jgi:hypothetical protein
MRLIQRNIVIFYLVVCTTLAFIVNAGTETETCEDVDENAPNAAWIDSGGYIIVIWGICVMFWGLALVCEEFFVPALHVLCEELQIPDGKIFILLFLSKTLC